MSLIVPTFVFMIVLSGAPGLALILIPAALLFIYLGRRS